MTKIYEDMKKTGNWLFRFRGSFPLLIIPIVLFALLDSEFFEKNYGKGVQTVWEVFCILVSFFGLFLRSLTVGWAAEGTSGRNTQGQYAESINTTGIYSVVRHPLYLANFFIIFGFVLFIQVWWLVIIYVLFFWLFYERIMMAEESFLEEKFGQDYRQWAEQTPAFLPNLKKWVSPKTSFSWKMVLQREYSTFLGIIAGLVAIKFMAELVGENELTFRVSWIVFIVIGAVVYLTLRTIRKKTKWFSH